MEPKRKASSPCESRLKTLRSYQSPDSSFESVNSSFIEEIESTNSSVAEEIEMKTAGVIYKVTTKNGAPFTDGLNHVQGYQVWTEKIKIPDSFLYGIALVQTKGKPFLFDYRLNCMIEEEKIPKEFKITLGEHEYELTYLPQQSPPASIGDEVVVTVKRTRWNLSPDQVTEWLSKYGDIVKVPEFEEAPGLKNFRTDDIRCVLKLRKHIPNLLPAFGRRMNVTYPGQPTQCGKCFQIGHFRASCSNDQVDWLKDYVKGFYASNFVTSKMLGRWFELLQLTSE